MGTPDFLAPEQSRNLHDADIRSDLYGLGCTFYFLLTGQVPFPGGNILEKLSRHERKQALPLEVLRPDLPASVALIVRKLMAKNPADRYQTPGELMDALAPYATPMVTEWPNARPSLHMPAPQGSIPTAVQKPQVDTEPRAQTSTHINDTNSLLEWMQTNRRQHHKSRRVHSPLAAPAW